MRGMVRSLMIMLFVCTGSSFADPIVDGAYQGYKAGWFPSSGDPCPVVCRKNGVAPAEFEAFSSPSISNRRTYVCKAPQRVTNPSGRGWLYGNNFDSPNYRNLCLMATPAIKVQRSQKFHCLCVFP